MFMVVGHREANFGVFEEGEVHWGFPGAEWNKRMFMNGTPVPPTSTSSCSKSPS
jgi:hypothetical protein